MTDDPPLPAVSAGTLARLLGVTPKEIYDLSRDGVLQRGAGRMFAVEANVAAYCEHLRKAERRVTERAHALAVERLVADV